jgi:hypothetical protein
MEKMTITEALAEIKLCERKLEKKWDAVKTNTHRFEHVKDPYASEGGSKVAISREVQSIKDIEERIVKIRTAIADANVQNKLTLGENTRSIYEWLTWKREIAENQKKFYKDISSRLKAVIDKESQNPTAYKDEENRVHLAKLDLNLDYPYFQTLDQKLSDTLETLDGKLSLKNATIVIEF